jgi:hypothetical protein
MEERSAPLSTPATIPLHIEQRRLYRDDDLLHHEVSFGVVGVEKPAAVVIASELYESPVIIERRSRGVLDLPDRLIDDLAVAFFRLMSGVIIEHGGESGWWTLPDVGDFIRSHFAPADAEQIARELSRHVQPGWIVRNTCLVADDDAI